MTFDEFALDERLLQTLASDDITEPTPIQAGAIPIALEGRDVMGIAQTGTGKTLAFSLPAIQQLATSPGKPPGMLVLVPTRELCVQVERVIEGLAKAVGLKSVQVYGGVSINDQADRLAKGIDIVVATPGRLLDQIERRNVRLDSLRVLVMDEADRMLDMGFLPDIQRIMSYVSKKRQTLMFSATFPTEIERFANTLLTNPEKIQIGMTTKPVDKVRQLLYPVHPQKKTALVLDILEHEDVESTLIFLRTKDRTERLGQTLKRKGYKIALIHGDRSQIQRQRALDGFREGKYNILVATDVAARGLDIDGVSHVINYDIPVSADDYIHRIGRTARAQSEGDAFTLVSPDEFQSLATIEKALGKNIERVVWGDAPTVISTFSAKGGRRGSRRGSRRRGVKRP